MVDEWSLSSHLFILLHHDFGEFTLAAAKDRRKEDESTSVSHPHSFSHSYISLLNKPWSRKRSSGAAVHVGFPLCSGSVILVPNSEVCSLRIHTSDSRQEAKQGSCDVRWKEAPVCQSQFGGAETQLSRIAVLQRNTRRETVFIEVP